MLTFQIRRLRGALLGAACIAAGLTVSGSVLSAPAPSLAEGAARESAPRSPSAAFGPAVRGVLVRLKDAPEHVATAGVDPDRRRAAVVRSNARWRALLATTGLGAEAGVRLEPVGRDAWRVVFHGARSPATVARWVATLSQQAEVDWAVPNVRETALQSGASLPDDPLFGSADGQWWLWPASGSDSNALADRRRGVPGFQTAWARTTGGAASVVAILDSGISAHPDLDTSRLLPGYDMVSDWDASTGTGYANDGDGRDADPTDPGDWVDTADRAADPARYAGCPLQQSDWHGTAVAGFLAATVDNARGISAATWNGRLLPVRVAGKCGAEVADIVDGMRWAAGLSVCRAYAVSGDASTTCKSWAPRNPTPARIVNISFGGANACNAAYQEAIDELHDLGVVVVAAGGNDHAAPTRPANCRGVLGVAALNRDGFKAVYSNFGPALKIATVGGDDTEGAWGAILTDGGLRALGNDGATRRGNPTYPHHYGTSFAAPIVAAAGALMLDADPALTADQLMQGLQDSARPHVSSRLLPQCSAAHPGRCLCTTATCGAGILDVDQAVAFAQAAAQGADYTAPRRAQAYVEGAEVAQAVALGADLPAATSDATAGVGAPVAGADSSGGSSGGGAVDPIGLFLLATCLALLARREATATDARASEAINAARR